MTEIREASMTGDLDDYPGGWFGVSWGAPVCDPDHHRPTPVGQVCAECPSVIGEGDQGLLVPDASRRLYAHHLDCFLRGLGTKEVPDLRDRLARIAGWHARESGPVGTVGDFCTECGTRWPCDTRRMAEGTYVEDPDLLDAGEEAR